MNRHRLSRVRLRAAFTVIELLVVITIIAGLVAILMPAVQGAREAARRNTCSNNVKQLALAAQAFHASKNAFPYARKYDFSATGNNPNPASPISGLTNPYQSVLTYTWIHSLLPFMELANVYKQLGNVGASQANNGLTYVGPSSNTYTYSNGQALSTNLFSARSLPPPNLLCPSDLAAPMSPTDTGPNNNMSRWRGSYAGNVGTVSIYGDQLTVTVTSVTSSVTYTATQYTLTNGQQVSLSGVGVFQVAKNQTFDFATNPSYPPPVQIQSAHIRDGLSKTLLFAEVIGSAVGDGTIGSTPAAAPMLNASTMGDIQAATMGGAFFSTFTGPNGNSSVQLSGGPTTVSIPDQVLVAPLDINDRDYLNYVVGVNPPQLTCTSTNSTDGKAVTDATAYAASRSRHNGLVVVGFADGSSRTISDIVDIGVWQSLGTINNSYALAHPIPTASNPNPPSVGEPPMPSDW
jgi:type II secretory pathway pseudopilin PulG